ncbi:hypothetical protein NKJ59_30900, partial [Mesorhizobium australicum]
IFHRGCRPLCWWGHPLFWHIRCRLRWAATTPSCSDPEMLKGHVTAERFFEQVSIDFVKRHRPTVHPAAANRRGGRELSSRTKIRAISFGVTDPGPIFQKIILRS